MQNTEGINLIEEGCMLTAILLLNPDHAYTGCLALKAEHVQGWFAQNIGQAVHGNS